MLEVGVDRGTTFIPLAVHLLRTRPQFTLVGVDVMAQESVLLMLRNIDVKEEQRIYMIEENSLTALPKLIEGGTKFDVVMLDGDHNYHTVSRELDHILALTYNHSIVVVDDYDGRWSDRDLWYAERPGYEDVKGATARVETKRHGVKPAVDEWLEKNPEWQLHKLLPGEPVLLTRRDVFTFNEPIVNDSGWASSAGISNTAEEDERTVVLARFVEMLNAYGEGSEELHVFRNHYEGDLELTKLFDTTLSIKRRLAEGKLELLPGDIDVVREGVKQ